MLLALEVFYSENQHNETVIYVLSYNVKWCNGIWGSIKWYVVQC